VTLKLDKSSVKGGGLRWQQTKAAKNQRNKKKRASLPYPLLKLLVLLLLLLDFRGKKKRGQLCKEGLEVCTQLL
jgi:hypothetical protein